jgi:Protein of unknown function (DUF3617)
MPQLLSRSSFVVTAAMLAAFCLPAAAQEKDELWEITMKMEMPGMPVSMPPRTVRECVAKGAGDGDYIPRQQQGECRTLESKRVGNKTTWKSVCEGKMQMTGTGEITFGDGTYDGKMQMTGNMDGRPMNMTQTYSGKRVGNCTAPPKAR